MSLVPMPADASKAHSTLTDYYILPTRYALDNHALTVNAVIADKGRRRIHTLYGCLVIGNAHGY